MIHQDADVCPCRPTVIPVERGDGSMGWVYAHNEPGQTPEQQAERSARVFEAIGEVAQ